MLSEPPMSQPIPPDLFPRAQTLIVPLVKTDDERETLLVQAFHLHDPLLSTINRNGTPTSFTVNCIARLLTYECVTESEHALARLLTAARYYCGVNKHPEIDALIDMANRLCAPQSTNAAPVVPPAPAPVMTPPQTITTPYTERRPTVFISYSHRDTAFAQRLIADLQAAGHPCWIDTTEIKGGDEWIKAITEGINNSYAFITVVSEPANGSTWVRREFLWAEYKKKAIFPLLATDCELQIYMMERQAIVMHADYPAGLRGLLAVLPASTLPDSSIPVVEEATVAHTLLTDDAPRPVNRRRLELDYLDGLSADVLFDLEKYTPLGGESEFVVNVRQGGKPLNLAVMRQEFEHLTAREERQHERRRFENAVDEILHIKRAVLLGEPGGGKTTTLLSLAGQLANVAKDDPGAPLPLFVRLGRWTQADQPLKDFIAQELGALGAHLDALIAENRAVPLLDGLNEIPVGQRDEKYPQVRALITRHPDWIAVTSCREQDYTVDLGLDRITVTPLDPRRIREFVGRYLGEKDGETLFWQIAGGEAVREVWQVWERTGATFDLFWNAPDIPRENPNVHSKTTVAQDTIWREKVRSAGSLMALAHNPYMLTMLTQVYVSRGDLPPNRGELFRDFVNTLFLREGVLTRDPATRAIVNSPVAEALAVALAKLAYTMQVQRASKRQGGALTALPMTTVATLLDERQRYLAGSTSILDLGDEVRFTHQLLQEYFAARYMQAEIEAGRLQATDLWPPERWWERNNWEEATILLAGLYSDDCTRVLEWVAAANPEVAAQCAARSGARVPDATLLRFGEQWLPRLTDLRSDRNPLARAAIGSALGQVTLSNGEGLDNRHGVRVVDGLPDMMWLHVETSPDPVTIKTDENEIGPLVIQPFFIAQYQVTYTQFQSFLEATDGFNDDRWWEGMPEQYKKQAMSEQNNRQANAPRDRVSWYQGVAFGRWMTHRFNGLTLSHEASGTVLRVGDNAEIRLPLEWEWQWAAQGGSEQRQYPWGEWKEGYANTNEAGLKRTSAVGMYPQGVAVCGALDMAGNVWEWCQNDREDPSIIDEYINDNRKVVRGGSFLVTRYNAACACRNFNSPNNIGVNIGLRFVVAPLIASLTSGTLRGGT